MTKDNLLKCSTITKFGKKWQNNACKKFKDINLCGIHSNVVTKQNIKYKKWHKKKWQHTGGWGEEAN